MTKYITTVEVDRALLPDENRQLQAKLITMVQAGLTDGNIKMIQLSARQEWNTEEAANDWITFVNALIKPVTATVEPKA